MKGFGKRGQICPDDMEAISKVEYMLVYIH